MTETPVLPSDVLDAIHAVLTERDKGSLRPMAPELKEQLAVRLEKGLRQITGAAYPCDHKFEDTSTWDWKHQSTCMLCGYDPRENKSPILIEYTRLLGLADAAYKAPFFERDEWEAEQLETAHMRYRESVSAADRQEIDWWRASARHDGFR